ncbi:MAG: RidA family protein [Candidatus Sericytochromatia bacterium]|nr:RidA family protein [Candidatus Tanganyikabacteria bacterium]
MTAVTRNEGPNGTSFILAEGTSTLAHYPHARAAGGLLWVSGLSARRPDQSIPGVVRGPAGVTRDFGAQAEGVFDNLERVLAAAEADLSHVVDIFAMLVDLADYPAFNEAYNRRFDAQGGPTRTTCVVRSLPLPDLLIELKVVAVDPGARP